MKCVVREHKQHKLFLYNFLTIELNIPYNLIFTTQFNDSLSLADEHVGDVTIQTQVIEYNQNFLQAD